MRAKRLIRLIKSDSTTSRGSVRVRSAPQVRFAAGKPLVRDPRFRFLRELRLPERFRLGLPAVQILAAGERDLRWPLADAPVRQAHKAGSGVRRRLTPETDMAGVRGLVPLHLIICICFVRAAYLSAGGKRLEFYIILFQFLCYNTLSL